MKLYVKLFLEKMWKETYVFELIFLFSFLSLNIFLVELLRTTTKSLVKALILDEHILVIKKTNPCCTLMAKFCWLIILIPVCRKLFNNLVSILSFYWTGMLIIPRTLNAKLFVARVTTYYQISV